MVDVELARVRPHPEVPPRRQLAAWLASGIRDGEIEPGERLPSVRRLAELVGVHRNTAWAVYGELRRRGLVRPVHGSGVYARPIPVREGNEREPRSRGSPRSTRLPRRVTVVEEGRGLRTVLAAELRRALRGAGIPVRAAQLSRAACAGDPLRLRDDLVVGLAPACRRLAARVPLARPPEPLRLRGGRWELRRVAALEPPAVVAVVSASRRVRAHARELLAGWSGIGVATPDPEEEAALARALRVADLVFADASCTARARRSGRRARPLRCLRREDVARLGALLGLVPRAGRADRAARGNGRGRGARRACRTRSYTPA